MYLGQGKSRYFQLIVLARNCGWANLKIGNVDPRPREGEGEEGAGCRRVWLGLFVQCSANGWLLSWVSGRAEEVLVLDIPLSSLLGARIIGGVVRRYLSSITYCNILGLPRFF